MKGKLRGRSSSGGAGSMPKYRDEDLFFTVKVHHGGCFNNQEPKEYVGGMVSYFDGCHGGTLSIYEFEEMLIECVSGEQKIDAWLKIPDEDSLVKVDSTEQLDLVGALCLYSREIECFVQVEEDVNEYDESDIHNFNFTQFFEEETMERLEQIREEFVTNDAEGTNKASGADLNEDHLSFEGDSSNMDSETEAIMPKKKKKIPPPNPPYRVRRRCRHAPLRMQWTNNSEHPVVIDDDWPLKTQESGKEKKSQKSDKGKQKISEGERRRLRKATEAFMIDDSGVVRDQEFWRSGIRGEDTPNSARNNEQHEHETNVDIMVVAGEKNREEEAIPEQKGTFDALETIDEKAVEGESDSVFDSADERIAISSCDEDDIQYPEFNEVTGMDDPQFKLGMLFASGAVFRKAVRQHAIKHRRAIVLKKNNGDKVKWICKSPCKWKATARKQQRSNTFQMTILCDKHTCTPTWEQKQVNSAWIARLYEEDIRLNPTWPLDAFHKKVVNDLKCKVSQTQAYRAFTKAKHNIWEKYEEQYKKLFDYANEIKKVMPRSTVKLMTEVVAEGTRFKRFYVCLEPLKWGFLEGCKPLIGLDGCHLRGPCGGILLTAVVSDPNDGMYPLAWAQVEAENNDSWDWFLKLLNDDLNMENEGGYTFISDRQKGLVAALESNVPSAEHRFCVMHLYRNIWKDHKGLAIRNYLWSAARATTEYMCNKHMAELKKVSSRAHDWLAAKPKSQWSRSGFREIYKSDMFVNNICEVFNKAISDFRDMGILCMFKEIHRTAMERIRKRKIRIEKLESLYCPNALRRLEKSMQYSGGANPSWNGADKYLVTMTSGGHEIVVNLPEKNCACRKWQLTGIPCVHACACIFDRGETPFNNDYIHRCHLKEQYMNVYNHTLEPIPGEEYWEHTDQGELLPPDNKKAPGRPKKKRSQKNDTIETVGKEGSRLKRKGTSLTCSYCKGWGHNSVGCEAKKADKVALEWEVALNGGPAPTVVDRGVNEAEVKVRRPQRCGHCKVFGHNTRSCNDKKQGLPAKVLPPKEKANNNDENIANVSIEVQHDQNNESNEVDEDENNASKCVEPHQIHLPPTTNVIPPPSDERHGGIFVESVSLPQNLQKAPFGVEASTFKWQGKQCTTLKNLDKAKRQKLLGMKSKPAWMI